MVAHASPLAVLPMPDKPAFKDPTTLTRWTKGVLYAETALSVVPLDPGERPWPGLASDGSPAAGGLRCAAGGNLVSIAADALDIPLDLILIVIIGRIYRMQMDHLARTPKIEQTETGSASAVSTST
jgi:hypothetical protein